MRASAYDRESCGKGWAHWPMTVNRVEKVKAERDETREKEKIAYSITYLTLWISRSLIDRDKQPY
jgi:hypothetical protein